MECHIKTSMSQLAKHFKDSNDQTPVFEVFSLPKQQKSKSKLSKSPLNKQTTLEDSVEDGNEDETTNKIDRTEQDQYTIFVGNLPTSFNVKKLAKLFKEIGEVKSARIRAVSTSKAKLPAHMVLKDRISSVNSLYGYVVFAEIEHTRKAVEKFNGQLIRGRHLSVDLCNKNEKKDCKTTVFVSNLHKEVDEEILWDFFSESGQVVKLHIATNRVTGESRNFGFVTFKDRSDLVLALKKNGNELRGRNLVIKKANAKHKEISSSKKRIVHKTPKKFDARKTPRMENKLTEKPRKMFQKKIPEKREIKTKKFQQTNKSKQHKQQFKKSKKFAKNKQKFSNPLLPRKPQTKAKKTKK